MDECFRRKAGLDLGQRELCRARGAIWAAITRRGIVSPRRSSPSRGVAPTTTPEPAAADIPAVGADVDSGELIAAQLSQVLVMHDPGDGSEVGACSREPPRGDQYLGRCKDAHHDSMGTCRAR
jgi:hypothetical protein